MLLLAAALGLTISANAQITFLTGTWAETKAVAKKEKKMIFIDAYTTWCGPCKMLSKNVFTDKAVGDFYNTNYVNFKMDMEKGEGIDFAKTYAINAYPTLLYFNQDGEIAHRTVGAPPIEQFIANGKSALDPNKQYHTLSKAYEKGDRKPEFLRNMALAAREAGAEDASSIMAEFFKTMPKEDWSKPENADFVALSVTSFESEAFQYMDKNQDKFTEEQFQSAIFPLLDAELGKIIESKDEEAMKVLQAKITKYLPTQAEAINPKIKEIFYQQTGNAKKAEESIDEKLAKSTDWQEFNQAAWGAYENETDNAKLQKALGWAKKSVELQENFYNTDTYAHLYHKLGNKKEAMKWAKKAIEIGKKAKEDTSGTEALIKKINSKK